MRRNHLIILFLLPIIGGCFNRNEQKYVEIKTYSGETAKGDVIKDSIFHGIVRYYDSANENYLGYATFRYGYEYGPFVRLKNGIAYDSLFYAEPIKNGYEYLFDSKEKLVYAAYLLDGRVFGPAYEYDTLGSVRHFYFYNFEGDIIYQSKFDSSGRFERGSPINFKVHDRIVNDMPANILFLYTIDQPGVQDYYELAILDKNRKRISSKRITTDKHYYEGYLTSIPPDQHYAIIYHYSPKNDGDVVIQEIFL